MKCPVVILGFFISDVWTIGRRSRASSADAAFGNSFLICCCFSSPSRSHRAAPSVVLKDYQACRIYTHTYKRGWCSIISAPRKRIICRDARIIIILEVGSWPLRQLITLWCPRENEVRRKNSTHHNTRKYTARWLMLPYYLIAIIIRLPRNKNHFRRARSLARMK